MRVALYAESSADEAALGIISEAVLGVAIEPVGHAGLRHRGWPAVRTALRSILLELHYHTDAEGFVFIVDSNGSTPHLPAHNLADAHDPTCRLCELRQIALAVQRQVRPLPHLPPLKIALGTAVPAIEAWLLCGMNHQVSEATWLNGIRQGQIPYSRPDLKNQLYGTTRPSLAVETEVMTQRASHLAANLQNLRAQFPNGFGALHADLMNWK